MKGSQKVIDLLNKLLAGELTAMDQYLSIPECTKIGA